MLLYLAWQAIYLLVTEVILVTWISQHQEQDFALRYTFLFLMLGSDMNKLREANKSNYIMCTVHHTTALTTGLAREYEELGEKSYMLKS